MNAANLLLVVGDLPPMKASIVTDGVSQTTPYRLYLAAEQYIMKEPTVSLGGGFRDWIPSFT